MAVSLYTGVPGSGKSYEVVAFVILPAIAKGRRVVTNIAGFDEDTARDYALRKLGAVPSSLGSVHLVDDEEITENGFFPVVGKDEPAVVQAGDLVVIDEAWKFWGSDSVINAEALDFFRKHRHLTDAETGVSCDLVVIAQEPMALHRKIRGVIELSFKAKKAKSIGLTSVYSVQMFEGPNQRRKPIAVETKKYNKDIFPIYNSYSASNGAAGKEMVVDGRQNILKSWRVLVLFPLVVFLGFIGIYAGLNFFKTDDNQSNSRVVITENQNNSSPPIQERFGTSTQANVSSAPIKVSTPPLSTVWRLAGFLKFGGRSKVILIDATGRVRYVASTSFSFEDNIPIMGVIDGERITPWSGSLSPVASLPTLNPRQLIVGEVGG